MVQFIGTVDDPHRADWLGIAIEGRGAFRRFKDVLARGPGELDRWCSYGDDRQRGRARAWLAEAGHQPIPAHSSVRWMINRAGRRPHPGAALESPEIGEPARRDRTMLS